MLDPETVTEIERLLAEDQLSQRAIARQLGVSRGTVGTIAAGRRPDYEAMRRSRQERETPTPSGPLRRCPECGARVQLPCVACHVRGRASDVPRLLQHARRLLDEPLGVNLKPQHQRRYEEIRARKQQEEAQRTRHETQRERAARRSLVRMKPHELLAALALDE